MSEVITSARPFHAVSPESLGEENRRFARKPCKLSAKLTFNETLNSTFDSTQTFDVIVRDISRNGLCLLFYAQLYPDDRLTLNFGDLVRAYRVARCRQISEQCYEIGVAIYAPA